MWSSAAARHGCCLAIFRWATPPACRTTRPASAPPCCWRATLLLALTLLAHASAANTTWRSPLAWPGAPDWKLDYANPTRLTPEALAPLRAEAEHARLTARALRDARLPARAHPVQD